jgi:hypothetical protein
VAYDNKDDAECVRAVRGGSSMLPLTLVEGFAYRLSDGEEREQENLVTR